MKLQFGNYRFRHLGSNMFIVNNYLMVRIKYTAPNTPTLEYVANPLTRIPNEIISEFLEEIKKYYPKKLPKEIIS